MQSRFDSENKTDLRAYIETYHSKLYAMARACVPRKFQAQAGISDVVQETCLRAYRHLASFRGTSLQQFGAWLRSILHHQLQNLFKRQHLKIDLLALHPSIPVQQFSQTAVHQETPSHIMMACEEQDIMYRALEQLSAEERSILVRHHRDKYTFAELGVELQCSEEAARKRWARALLRWQRLAQSTHA